jgi:hypothetical protein
MVLISRWKEGESHAENIFGDDDKQKAEAQQYFGNLANLMPNNPLAEFFRHLANPPSETEIAEYRFNRACDGARDFAQRCEMPRYAHAWVDEWPVSHIAGRIKFLMTNERVTDPNRYNNALADAETLIKFMGGGFMFDGLTPEQHTWVCASFVAQCATSY